MRRLGLVLLVLAAGAMVCTALMPAPEACGRKPPQPERRKPAENDVPFTPLESGAFSGVNQRTGVAVKDEGEWLALWRRHKSNEHPPPPVPHVDFGQDMVLAVFSGEHGSGGYAIQIDRIKDT